jgi:hypothetical protein
MCLRRSRRRKKEDEEKGGGGAEEGNEGKVGREKEEENMFYMPETVVHTYYSITFMKSNSHFFLSPPLSHACTHARAHTHLKKCDSRFTQERKFILTFQIMAQSTLEGG